LVRLLAETYDDASSYFGYYAATSPCPQLRAGAEIIRALVEIESNRSALLERGYGSEVVMLLRVSEGRSG
jgi:hypothetical protein